MKYQDKTFVEVFRLLDAVAEFSGQDVANLECPPVFGNDTLGQAGALYQTLGPDIIAALRRGDVALVLDAKANAVMVEYKEKPRMDDDGRFLFTGIKAPLTRANWAYGFDKTIQPAYAEVQARLEDAYQCKGFIPAQEFMDRAEAKKLEMLKGPYAKLFTGAQARPFAVTLPSVNILEGKLGHAYRKIFVPAAGRGYKRQFPERQLNDYRKETLVDQTETFPGSHQERLIEALRQGSVVMWVFLNCLQGASINADRELVERLPEEIILNGVIPVSAVIAAYSEVAASSAKNPLYYCAADSWQSSRSLGFGPGDACVIFDYYGGLGDRYGSCSGGVSVLA